MRSRIPSLSRPIVLVPFALVCALGLQTRLQAQVSGSISGYVHDPSGGVIPGAKISATTTDQGATRQAVTDSTGFYNLVSMPRGNYVVTASATGFSTAAHKNVELTAGGDTRVDFEMTVGQVSEQVTVTGTAPLVETTTATESSLIDDRRVQDLPLNGRNVIGLTLTLSNVNAVSASQTMSDARSGPIASANGSNQNANYYTLNGAAYMNFDQTTGYNPPPPDAIQEIRMQTHDFPAEYGFTTGSVISMVTKAGTRQIHGSAWEFFRSDVLNARSYFQTKRPRQTQNQPGITAGGPFPGGKAFWFGSYQLLSQRQDAGATTTPLPTPAQRSGDFTALSTRLTNPKNPLTGAPLTSSTGQPCVVNNVVNPGCISPAAQTILNNYIPTNAANSLTVLAPNPFNNYNILGRVDYNVAHNNLAFVTFTWDHTDTSNLPSSVNYINQSIFTNIGQGSIHDVHTFTPNLINEGVFAYTYNKAVGGPNSVIQPSALGVNVPLDPSGGRGLSVSITGGPNLTYPGITYEYYNQFELNDAMTWIHGRHTVRFGYQGIWSRFFYKLALTRSLTFSGVETGNSEADFLLGRFDTGTFNYGAADNSPIGWKHALFAEDTYKLTPRLTMEYGLRWEPFTPYTQQTGRNLSFIPGQQSTVHPDSPPGILFEGDPQVPHSLVFARWNQFAPRLGFAWDAFGNQKTVIRAAGGTFYQAEGGDITHSAQAPWEGTDVLRNGLLDDPFGSLNLAQPPTNPSLSGSFGCTSISTFPGLKCAFGLPITFVYTDPHFKVATTEHYTLNIQQQLSPNWLFETSYVGQVSFNQGGHNQFNAARSINDPITGAPPSAQNVNDRVSFEPGILSPQDRVLGNFYHSNYNAWNVSLRSNVVHGFSLTAGYTWAKAMTNLGDIGVGEASDVPDPFNLNLNRSPALFDVRHTVAVSEIWSPKVHFSNGFARHALENWTVTGLHRFQTGTPINFVMGTDVAQNGSNYASTAQIAMFAPGQSNGSLPVPHPNHRADVAQYFNTAAILNPRNVAPGSYGNVRRGAMYGPGYVDHDISLMRNIPLGFREMNAQLRCDAFNTFNRVNFNNPDAIASSAAFGQIQGANPGRILQLAFKILW